jgi:hypothetical protein
MLLVTGLLLVTVLLANGYWFTMLLPNMVYYWLLLVTGLTGCYWLMLVLMLMLITEMTG